MSCDFRILCSFYSQTNNDITKNLTRINSNWKHETTIFLCLLWPHPLDLYLKSNLSQESTADSTVYSSPDISKFWKNQNNNFFEPIWFAEYVKTQKPVHILTMEQQVFVPVVEDFSWGLYTVTWK